MAHDVFISYSSKDKPVADAVCAGLETRGIRCWIAPRDIMPGVEWGGALIDAITASKVMVLIFSSNANSSPQIKREVERAVAKGVRLLPFRIEDVPLAKTLEYFISTPHWLDALTQPLEGHIAKLADTVRLLMAARESGQLLPPRPGAPTVATAKPAPFGAVAAPARSTPSRKPLVLGLLALAAALYFFVLRKAPPEIVALNFPTSITAGGHDTAGTIQFKAGQDEIVQAQFEVVSAERFEPFTIELHVGGQKKGSFPFSIHASVPQQVTLKATLLDAEGRRSRPVSFSFEVKKATSRGRAIEIEPPPIFKFKIPH